MRWVLRRRRCNIATAATIAARLTLDTKNYESGIKKAEAAGKSLSKKLEGIGTTMRKVGGIMTASLTAPIVAGMTKSVMAAGDLEQATGAVEVVFGDAADTILDFSKTSSTMVGMASSDYQQLAAEAGALLLNMGMDSDTAAEATVNLAERAADMAAVYNTDVTTAMEAIQSGLRGMGRPLTAFGVKLDVATVEAKALEMGLIGAGDELDETAKATATLAVIMDQTANISGHFASEAETLDGQMKRLKAELGDAAAELGTYLLPMVTDAVKSIRSLVERFRDLAPFVQKSVLGFAGLAAAIGPALMVGGQMLIWVSKLKTGYAVLKPAILAANTALTGTGVAANAALGPLGLVTAAIMAVVAAVVIFKKKTEEQIEIMGDAKKVALESGNSYEEYQQALKDAEFETDQMKQKTSEYRATLKTAEADLKRLRDEHIISKDKYEDLYSKMSMGIITAEEMSKIIYELENNMSDMGEETEVASLGLDEYADRAAKAAWEAFGLGEMIETANDKQRLFTEELNKVQGLDANFSGIISMAKQYDETMGEINQKQEELDEYMQIIEDHGGYLDGAWVGTNAAKEEVERLTGEIGTLQQSMTDMANQAVLDMFMATISIDGITTAEAEAYFKMAEDMELISSEAANYAMQVYGDAIDEINALELIDKHANYTVETILKDPSNIKGWKLQNKTVTYTVNTVRNELVPEQRQAGGPVIAGNPYLVGERGPEIIVPSTSGQVIPNHELKTENNFNLTMPTSNNPEDVATMFDLMQAWVGG